MTSYESTAEPIKLGYLFDFVLPERFPQEMRDDLTDAFRIVFEEGLEQGVIDRPIEIIFREVEGLPKGSVKAVIDAYGELVDEGCLAIFGPAITDNAVPRFMGTSFQNAYIAPIVWNAVVGWIGLDQYDDGNELGQEFLDRYEKRFGRRPEYCVPVVNRDLATVLLRAFADARPLSPRGVRDALERVHMIPAASGSPGTRISFGKWNHRGWMGAGYLVARRLDEDGKTAHLVERFGDK